MRLPLLILVALLAAAPALAQPGRGPEDLSPARVHQLFDAMLVMQAQNALELNDDQYAQFVPRVKALQDARRRGQQMRARMINELQRITGPRNAKPVEESDLRRRLDALRDLDTQLAADVRRAYDSIDQILTPVQQARFRVLEEQIERRKLELVGRARQNKRPSPRR
jgi:hypothetical protein